MAKSIPLTHKHTCRPMENKIMKLVYTDSLGAACLVLIQSRTHVLIQNGILINMGFSMAD